MTHSTNDILEERGKTYGSYAKNAMMMQHLKDVMKDGTSWRLLTSTQRQSVEIIVDKLCRIVNGDPTYMDSWQDIAGYAELVLREPARDNPMSEDKKPAETTMEGHDDITLRIAAMMIRTFEGRGL